MLDPAELQYVVTYGPDENCTLALCPASLSVYQYRPTLGGNAAFIAVFGIAMIIHVAISIKWRSVFFGVCLFTGCVCELIGYGGRIMLYNDPFSFNGFLIQIICITFAPVFFTAAIYQTLYRIIVYLGPQHARFRPKLYYWIFIPCDILSLILQAVGGSLSSTSSGGSRTAVDVSIAGLSFQVFTLCVFIALALEYAYRWRMDNRITPDKTPLTRQFKIFVYALSLSIILILIRCAYRIDELSDGYDGPLIHDEGLFIGLEGVMIVVAVYVLIIAHPGPVFGNIDKSKMDGADMPVESKQSA